VTRAFLITPFTPASAGGEDAAVFASVQDAIATAARDADIELQKANDIFEAGVVVDQIRAAIESADLILAVCTGKNPNVFYELGLAEVLGHKPILIASSSSDVPFDWRHWRAQMYGDGASVGDLAERLKLAMRATLGERSAARVTVAELSHSTDALIVSPTDTTSDAVSSATLISRGELTAFKMASKDLIRAMFDGIQKFAEENWDVQPTDEVTPAADDATAQAAEAIIEFLNPAIEHRSDFLAYPLKILGSFFSVEVKPSGSHFAFWQYIHQSWTYLSLRASAALASHFGAWDSLRELLSIRGPSTQDGDGSPLLLNPAFTWNKGFAGNSDKAFKAVVKFASQSPTLRQEFAPVRDALDAVCGSDLLLGLARWEWETRMMGEPTTFLGSRPYTYAGFADYYCQRIQWAARLVETDPVLATTLWAPDLDAMKVDARECYPKLHRLVTKDVGTTTCWSWEEAIR
jgi:hypothetical protein